MTPLQFQLVRAAAGAVSICSLRVPPWLALKQHERVKAPHHTVIEPYIGLLLPLQRTS